MKVFMDMKPGGALCTALATMFRFKSEQRWRKFDFQVGKVCTPVARQPATLAPPDPTECTQPGVSVRHRLIDKSAALEPNAAPIDERPRTTLN